MNGVGAVVLAGGRSSRFGAEKASARFLGRPMLAWVVEAASTVAEDVIVCTAAGQQLPALPVQVRTVQDAEEFAGPLAGLVRGLGAARQPWVVALACDTPLVQTAALRALLDRRAEGVDAIIPVAGGIQQPLVAVYRREAALQVFEQVRDAGGRSLRAATERLDAVLVDEDALRAADPDLVSFRAANTPAELATLEAAHWRHANPEGAAG